MNLPNALLLALLCAGLLSLGIAARYAGEHVICEGESPGSISRIVGC